MGSIIGGIIGGVGSLFGGSKSDKQASQAALTGYNYLNGNAANKAVQANTAPAIQGQNTALGAQNNVANTANALLTGTASPEQNQAFGNYLNSTGYNFQKQQGTQAITGSAAARGLLNSGATGKALTQYGTNLASTTFNNYLGQLQGVSNQYGNVAQGYGGQVAQGAGAAQAVGQAGTSGGGAAASAMTSGNSTQSGSGIGGLAGTVANIFAGI